MCGIVGGCWTSRANPLTSDELKRMLDSLRHRGPDDFGTYTSEASTNLTAALGHRRLSIIDLSSGQQPLSNEDGTVWLSFNGEIYNYRELREQLSARGHKLKSAGDSEVIVHLYEDHGVDCVNFLRGMFAFAIWDSRKQQLMLARDRLGQKPLFYRADAERMLFASELKALLQVNDAPRELDPVAIDDFLTYQYVPHPRCILKGYAKLPPGHRAVFSRKGLAVDRYWSPPFDRETSNRSIGDWQEELRSTMTESVRLRMRSDVPLGAFLSGGVDSTVIVGLMQEFSSRPVHTFSIGFPVKRFDETSYAREAAQRFGTEHHERIVEPQALDILPKLVWHYDEPFADSSAIPTMYLSELARETVTVALSGDAGDELFAGYDRYRAVRLAAMFDRLPRPLRAVLTSKLWQRIPASVQAKSKRRRLKRLLAALDRSPERRYLTWVSIFDSDHRRDLYSDGFGRTLGEHDSADFLLDAYTTCTERDFVTRTCCADVLTYLPCDLLTKVDIASMSVGLECRGPFLDHNVVELAAQMPIGLKQNRRGGKRILIETFANLIPPSIQSRPKMGFGVPIDHWFRNELRELLHDTLLSQRSRDRAFFRPEVLQQLVDEHTSGRRDHASRLWALLCLEHWQRTFLETTPPDRPNPLQL